MKLTRENYYSAAADDMYMSVSQFKRWQTCPAAAKAQYVDHIYKPETTDAMLHGSYFHELFDGSAEEFLKKTPELLTAKGLKTAPIKLLDAIFHRVKQDDFFMASTDGQHEEIYTAEFGGLLWKCRVDVVNFDREFFTDIKTVRNFEQVWDDESRHKVEFWQLYKYDLQLTVYQELIRLATGHKLDAFIAAVTKEEVPDYAVIEFSGEDMDTHFAYLLREAVLMCKTIKEIKSGTYDAWHCGKCDYCKQTKKLTNTKKAILK